MKESPQPAPDELDMVAVLSALANPVRLRIVRTLATGGELGWSELEVPVAKSTLSQHLKMLRDAGVTRTRREGTRCFVSLRREDLDDQFPGLLVAVLGAELGSPVTRS